MKLLYRAWLATYQSALRIVVSWFAIWLGAARLLSEPVAAITQTIGVISYSEYSVLLVILGAASAATAWNGFRRRWYGKLIAAGLGALLIMLGVELIIISAYASAAAIVLGLGFLFYEVLMPIYEC